MIDNPKQTAELLFRLQAALPFPAIVSPRLAATLRQRSPGAAVPKKGDVVSVMNMGDEGGIMCQLSTGRETDDGTVLLTSITHLDFDRRLPLAREILAYQKHRTKKLRRQAG